MSILFQFCPSMFLFGFSVIHGVVKFKGATSRFVYLETFSLNFSSRSFAIRVNLLHP